MALKDALLERTFVYRAWQAPFARRKLEPVLRDIERSKIRRVLDVGCGPGTNAGFFAGSDYIGVDINARYIEHARGRYGGTFVVADATQLDPATLGTFDLVLVNSFLHHLTDDEAARVLDRLALVVEGAGHIHVLDLVMPQHRGLPRLLAKIDRGDHPRPLEQWRHLFRSAYDEVAFEAYPLGVAGYPLWHMVHFKGSPRREG